jgi:hypothetical protein
VSPLQASCDFWPSVQELVNIALRVTTRFRLASACLEFRICDTAHLTQVASRSDFSVFQRSYRSTLEICRPGTLPQVPDPKMYSRAGRSKPAPANVQCQKCLKRDMCYHVTLLCHFVKLTHSVSHYSYECKAAPQERPYVARPSRTQQLLNPKLVPKLSSDTYNPLEEKLVSCSGVASVANSGIEPELLTQSWLRRMLRERGNVP